MIKDKAMFIKKHLQRLRRIRDTRFGRYIFLRLDKNENLVSFPDRFIRRIQKHISSNFISTYPEISPLYTKIAKWVGCHEKNIYITAGSDAAIKSVFEVFVRPKDKVLILHPSYAMYYVYAEMFQATLLKIKYGKDFSLSMAEILKNIKRARPRLVCIANPNSPTGTIIPPEDLKIIIDISSKFKTVVLVDEAYYLYYSHSVTTLINKYPNLVVTRSFSKALGLASLRLGAAVGCKSMVVSLLKVRPMYETNAFAALIGKMLLDNYALVVRNVNKTLEGKAYLEKCLDKMGIKYYKSYANFIVIDVGSYQKSCQIIAEMKKRKILIGGGYKHHCLNTCIRVTIGPKEYMRKFLHELQKLL